MAHAPVGGEILVEIRSQKREPARTARVELRSARVDLEGPWRPGGWQPPLPGIEAIEAREAGAPANVKEPLHWVLLTTLPCATLAEVQRVPGRYRARWWIEEYHKALKSAGALAKINAEV